MAKNQVKKDHKIKVDGALVFNGHIEVYKTPELGKYIIVAKTKPKNGEKK